MHVTMFWLPRAARGVDGPRPAGLYGAAWVEYAEPSPLTYRELLVARPVRVGAGVRVRITDIWVDSPASMAGGRALWAIPKGLADFSAPGPDAAWGMRAAVEGRTIAAAHVTGHPRRGPRLPVRFRTDQPSLPETDGPRVTSVRGWARSWPVGVRWDLPADGALGWLRAARPLASLSLEAFELRFG